MSEGKLAAICLMVITDHQRWSASVIRAAVARVCAGARSGSVVIQLRDREMAVRERLAIGRELREVTRETRQLLWVSDRLDLALLLDADGVALPEGGIPGSSARALLQAKGPERALISQACHDPAQLPGAEIDLCVLSPIILPRKGNDALGVSALRAARARLLPRQRLFALGGVDASNAAGCLAAGAHGVAVMGAVFERDPLAVLSAVGAERR